MNSFKNPTVPLLESPVGIDKPIQSLQTQLAELGWIDRSFGKAFNGIKSSEGSFGAKRVLIYPQVWQGAGKDLLEALPNDNLKSQSFFKVEDPIEVAEYVPDRYSRMRAAVGWIFWGNLKEINRDADHNFTELLKYEAQRKITLSLLDEGSSVKILRTWEGAANVFRGYDISQLKDQELVYPFTGFRFDLEINWQEDCES